MKNLILIALFVFVKQTNAQTYVAIPDSNFVHYLKTIVPTAFKGDSLNTSSTLVTTTTKSINVPGSSIANLSGSQYFTSLTYLNCDGNQLTNLPTLSDSLTYLSCINNYIATLPTLPNKLTEIVCFHNSLTTLPSLPTSLINLYCDHNSLMSLPALPNSIKQLSCGNNNLTSLPPLPDSLNDLQCESNNIMCFPTFPISITDTIYFNIDPNPYTCLPNYITAMSTYDRTHYPLCAAGNTHGCAVAGIQQVAGINNQVTVYPNPASTSLTLTLSKGEGTYSINIYDMLGKLVMQHTYSPPSEGQGEAIDVSDLSEGVYNICISGNETIINKRVIIVR